MTNCNVSDTIRIESLAEGRAVTTVGYNWLEAYDLWKHGDQAEAVGLRARVAELEVCCAHRLRVLTDCAAACGRAEDRVAELEAVAELVLGDWANVQTRDRLREVLRAAQ